MKKLVLTSLAGILAASAASAACVSPYVSLKGGYSVNNLAVKGDSLEFAEGLDFLSEIKTIVDPLDVRIHTNGVWSINPAVGAKFVFDDVSFATFRLEAEFAYNQKAKKELSLVGEDYRDDISVKMKNFGVMANAYIDFETNSFIKPFITAGLGWGRSKLNVAANETELATGESYSLLDGYTDTTSWKDNNLIWTVGAGLAFEVTDNISIDAEYRYMDNGSVKVDVVSYGESLGSIKVKDAMHQFMLGVRYTF